MPIRIFIVGPLEVMRAGIRLACSKNDDLLVVGESSVLSTSLPELESTSPHVVIFDLDSNERSCIESIVQAKSRLPETRFLVYTSQDRPEVAQMAMAAGAEGFLTKAARIDEIVVAVRSIFDGRLFISHTPTKNAPLHTVPHFAIGSRRGGLVAVADSLSRREREVIGYVADGLTNKQIAEKLFLSIKTIETYRARVMRKHGLADRSEVIQFAREAGLCDIAS
jgi:two-component system, NarL family, response regulator NreC